MDPSSTELPRHRNNVGFLRLVLASLVVVGHAAEVVGGVRADPLFAWSGTVFIAGSCVFGFFLISGFLIAQSMDRTGDVPSFVGRRALRIVPGFVVAYLLSVFVAAPALGGAVRPFWKVAVVNLFFLHEPPLSFAALEPIYQTINGSLWTISYEARCYLLVALLWAVGLFRRRGVILALAAVSCLCTVAASDPGLAARMDAPAAHRAFALLIGQPHWDVIYGATFLVGTCVYLYREMVLPRLNGWIALAAVVLLAACLRSERTALVALIVFGTPVIFWLGWRARLGRLQPINDRWDVSYGTYLYGWPATMAVRVIAPTLGPGVAGTVALLIAWACGAASWWGLERWFRWPSRKPSSRA